MKIYKYYSDSLYNVDALLNGYLWFSNPCLLNDPFDCNFEHILDDARFTSLSPKQKRTLKEKLNNFGVCSFTDSWDKEHFWSLYANCYRGFCVVFDRTDLTDYINSRLHRVVCQDVNYKTYAMKLVDELISTKKAKRSIIPIMKEYAYRKKDNPWSNENEYRFFYPGNSKNSSDDLIEKDSNGYKLKIERKFVKEVIIGHQVEKDKLKLIQSIMKQLYPGIPVSQIELDIAQWDIKKKKI